MINPAPTQAARPILKARRRLNDAPRSQVNITALIITIMQILSKKSALNLVF